jgi:hypothetical protein
MDLPRLIVLRIWADPARFRAVARELETGRTRSFTNPIDLLSYLCGECSQANALLPPPGGPPAT